MTRHVGTASVLGILVLVGHTLACPAARAQSAPTSGGTTALFRLPVEIGQGAVFADDAKDVRYSAHFTVLPGVGYGILDANAVLSLIYRNPTPTCFTCTLDAGTGLRVSVAAWSILEGALSFRFAVQGEYQPWAAAMRGALGFMPDLSSILRIGLWVGRDWASQAYYGDVTIAVDLMTLGDPVGAILRNGPVEDFGRATR
jgi:hypothetical protein